jgi:lipopolysaccharide cholinephosphotransferase
MNMTYEEVCSMNKVQLQIFKEFARVCQNLGLTYYMIHGSLLGAILHNGFFPYDDDIDVAMPRKDYEILMEKGQELLPKQYFLQSHQTESEYPLSFAKLRKTDTAFIQPVMKNFRINKGIYIDIFPIDYYPENHFSISFIKIKEIISNVRISCKMNYEQNQPFSKKILRLCSKLICPSLEKAIQKRVSLFSKVSKGEKVITVGGKLQERGIPENWFGEGVPIAFEDIIVNCPTKYTEYLTCIYGDYEHYNPAGNYMNEDGTVTVSAEKVSTTQSYLDID